MPHTDEQRAEAAWFFVLAEPARLKILRALAGGKKNLQELAAACGIASPNMSAHTGKLERAGLIVTERVGNYRWCALANARVTKTAIEFTHPAGRKAIIPRA